MTYKDGVVYDGFGQPIPTISPDPSPARLRLEAVKKIVDLYFSPWGAAKAAMWEELSGGGPFSAERAMELVRDALGTKT